MYRAITLDLWNTIIKSNPQYKKMQIELLLKYNEKLNFNDIEIAIFNIKKEIDIDVEKFGLHYDRKCIYNKLFDKIGINTDIDEFIIKCDKLFLQYYPKLYNSDIPHILSKLSNKYELHLISNTILIYGYTLKEALKILNLYKYFKSFTFSDEIGYSKPHYNIFYAAHKNIPYNKKDIIHVGDNPNCDCLGAKKYGFDSMLINYDNIINLKSKK